MGCVHSKEIKVDPPLGEPVSSTSLPLRIKIPNDISKKEISILPMKIEYNGSYFRD